jgi:hypothetical protein
VNVQIPDCRDSRIFITPAGFHGGPERVATSPIRGS